MTTQQQTAFLSALAESMKINGAKAGLDAILGAGSFDKIAGEIYDALRK